MSFPDPISIPAELRVESVSWTQKPLGQTAPSVERGGRTYFGDYGPALWVAQWQTDFLTPWEHGVTRGFLDRLITAGASFWAYDLLRPFPYQHPFGFAALGWNGTGNLASVAGSRAITVANVPNGLAMSPGDYVAFDYGSQPSRALHRLTNGASAGGGTISFGVAPDVRPGWSAGTAVWFATPSARMVLLRDTISEEVQPNRRVRLSFSAQQSL